MIEIASSADPRFDLREKRPRYRQAGIAELWWIQLEEKRVLADVREGGTYRTHEVTSGRLESSVVPGFWIEVEWLWRERMPSTYRVLRALLS